ncbi:MAG: hypothetical protein ABJA78_10240, partial [Ferruginibacter sp.]
MKKIFTISLFLLSLTTAFSQSVGVGTTTPNASAKLDVSSNTQGFLMPRMSTVQRRAIVNAAPGLMVFDLDKNTLYMYDGGNWNPLSFVGENTLSPTPRFPSDATSNKRFGKSVSISGNYAIVGAPGDTSGGGTSKGAAYVFFKSNNSWVQQAKLQAADGVAYDGFGSAVSIDGDYLVVGACFATVAGHYQQGAAYIFNRTGTSWLQQAKLSASDGVENDNFSTALAISGDNVIISAYLATVGSNTGQGAVYAFKRSGTSWPFQNKLVAADGMANNFFGMSVAVSGSYAVIGASNATIGADNNNGAAYVFVQGGGTWTFQTKLNGNAGGSYNFGFSVSISGDLIAVGAP